MPKTETSPAAKAGVIQERFNAAILLHQQGRLAEAQRIYLTIVEQTPDHFDALHLLGVIALQTGHLKEGVDLIERAISLNDKIAAAHSNLAKGLHDLHRSEEAIASYERAIALSPDFAQAHYECGNVLNSMGRRQEALVHYDKAIALQPKYADAHNNRGTTLAAMKRLEDALESYATAWTLKPDFAAAYYNAANALVETKRFTDALVKYDSAIRLKPDMAEAHYNRGNVLFELNRPQDALASYDQTIALTPHHAEAYLNRGNLLRKQKQLTEALTSYDKAIEARPDYAEAYINSGRALRELGRPDEALGRYNKAITLTPTSAEVHNNRGNALLDLGRIPEALESYKISISLNSNFVHAYGNYGNALLELMRIDEVLASHEKSIALVPDFAEGHWNLSLCRLLTGDFTRGWQEHEWRWKHDGFPSPRRNFTQPLWLGDATLSGKTILLHSEQGLGDTLQFCRYTKMVAELGASVILEAPKSLLPLLQTLEGVSQLVGIDQPLPPFDYHCPLLSLPLAFKTTLNAVPATIPYLSPSASHLAKWTQKLGPKIKPRIGLVWSGNIDHKRDRSRSIPLATMLPLIDEDLDYVSLQKEIRKDDAEIFTVGFQIRHFGGDLNDFADTAALCELMDIVISVDTSVAHLAGALGKETWILIPYIPDWRWLLERTDSPWYPSAKLFRQDVSRDWSPVIQKLRTELDSRK